MQWFKPHPFAVEAFFQSSVVLTFALPQEDLQTLIPSCLELDTFDQKWGFVAVAMVQTSNLRPKGLPSFLGRDFFLVGYRIFVRYTNEKGKVLRGLYILQSETNRKGMTFWGNLLTRYRYKTTDLHLNETGSHRVISAGDSDFKVILGPEGSTLPHLSPFAHWDEARKFSGPLPFTFSCSEKDQSIYSVQGVRQNWKPKPIEVIQYKIPFLDSIGLGHGVLASAFEISNVPYHWKKGRKEVWK